MAAKKIQGQAPAITTINLSALFGKFRAAQSTIIVKYASTYVNPVSGGGHQDLLEELKPVRECVEAKDLLTLGALLQRDLNDAFAQVASLPSPFVSAQSDPYVVSDHRQWNHLSPVVDMDTSTSRKRSSSLGASPDRITGTRDLISMRKRIVGKKRSGPYNTPPRVARDPEDE